MVYASSANWSGTKRVSNLRYRFAFFLVFFSSQRTDLTFFSLICVYNRNSLPSFA